jgi:peptidoglycan hydrolase CwlO-like protein
MVEVVAATQSSLGLSEIVALMTGLVAVTGGVTALIIRLYNARPERENLLATAEKTAQERQSMVNDAAETAQRVFAASVEALQKDLDRARADVKESRADMDRAMKELHEAREEIVRLQEAIKTISEQRDDERDAMSKRIDDLRAKISYLETKVGGRRTEDEAAPGPPGPRGATGPIGPPGPAGASS